VAYPAGGATLATPIRPSSPEFFKQLLQEFGSPPSVPSPISRPSKRHVSEVSVEEAPGSQRGYKQLCVQFTDHVPSSAVNNGISIAVTPSMALPTPVSFSKPDTAAPALAGLWSTDSVVVQKGSCGIKFFRELARSTMPAAERPVDQKTVPEGAVHRHVQGVDSANFLLSRLRHYTTDVLPRHPDLGTVTPAMSCRGADCLCCRIQAVKKVWPASSQARCQARRCYRCLAFHSVAKCPVASQQIVLRDTCITCGLPGGRLAGHQSADGLIVPFAKCSSWARGHILPACWMIRCDVQGMSSAQCPAYGIVDELEFAQWLFKKDDGWLPNCIRLVHWGLVHYRMMAAL